MAFLHLEAGHDLVAPCDSEQRRRNEWYLYWVYKMTILHDNTTKWVAIGCTKRFQLMKALQNGLPKSASPFLPTLSSTWQEIRNI